MSNDDKQRILSIVGGRESKESIDDYNDRMEEFYDTHTQRLRDSLSMQDMATGKTLNVKVVSIVVYPPDYDIPPRLMAIGCNKLEILGTLSVGENIILTSREDGPEEVE